jgi:hypothetical protein
VEVRGVGPDLLWPHRRQACLNLPLPPKVVS